ncbi:MAG: hypothetical protein IT518_24360 [Burkholderiales bacterium]|nr:hypothetical protein [Burkholderiales bacterium]
MTRRLAIAACVVAAMQVLLDVPQASAASTPEADVASLVDEACRLLRTDPEIRARFPGAVDLCTPGAPAAPACETRPMSACLRDALCAAHTTIVCDRNPCPPGGPARSTCIAGTIERLAASIVRYPLCIRSGGTWQPYLPVSPQAQWRGTCSCMGPSANAIAFTRNGYPASDLPRPLRYFVQGRGCVTEDALCREQKGTWVVKVPQQPWEPPRCEIDGREVLWRYQLRVDFAD